MENEKTFTTPPKQLAKMQFVHFGNILFRLQFLALAIMLASVISFLVPALYYLVLISVMLLTLFLIFAVPGFTNLWSGGETLTKVAEFMAQSWKFTVPIALALSAGAAICLFLDKEHRQKGKIVACVIVAVASAAVLILKLINNGGAA